MLLYMQHLFCHQQNATLCSWPCNPLKGFSKRKADYFIKKPFFVSSLLPLLESQVFNSIIVECNVRDMKFPWNHPLQNFFYPLISLKWIRQPVQFWEICDIHRVWWGRVGNPEKRSSYITFRISFLFFWKKSWKTLFLQIDSCNWMVYGRDVSPLV